MNRHLLYLALAISCALGCSLTAVSRSGSVLKTRNEPSLTVGLLSRRNALQQDRLTKPLIDAVEKGDREKVLALLNQGAKINAKWIDDTPSLRQSFSRTSR